MRSCQSKLEKSTFRAKPPLEAPATDVSNLLRESRKKTLNVVFSREVRVRVLFSLLLETA